MRSVPECTYRPSFRENKPKTLVFSHWKWAFWSRFRENWVYKFGHCRFLTFYDSPNSHRVVKCFLTEEGNTKIIVVTSLGPWQHEWHKTDIWPYKSNRVQLFASMSTKNLYNLSVLYITRGVRESHSDVVYLGWPIAPSYISPNVGGGGELRDLSQWVQLYEVC